MYHSINKSEWMRQGTLSPGLYYTISHSRSIGWNQISIWPNALTYYQCQALFQSCTNSPPRGRRRPGVLLSLANWIGGYFQRTSMSQCGPYGIWRTSAIDDFLRLILETLNLMDWEWVDEWDLIRCMNGYQWQRGRAGDKIRMKGTMRPSGRREREGGGIYRPHFMGTFSPDKGQLHWA